MSGLRRQRSTGIRARRRAPRPALLLLPLLLLTIGCRDGADPVAAGRPASARLTLLALGDSYTVGHSLPEAWSWPRQLADSLAAGGDTLQTLDVVARTGWTTGDLLAGLADRRRAETLAPTPYGLVTLMIGVNNQYQGLDLEVFAAELDSLLGLALELAGGDPDRVLGFTIPDYGVTPVGQRFDPERIRSELETQNRILQARLADAGMTCLDITPLSREAAADPGLVARDGLHYSREMYRRWVVLMLPEVRRSLGLADWKGQERTARAAIPRSMPLNTGPCSG